MDPPAISSLVSFVFCGEEFDSEIYQFSTGIIRNFSDLIFTVKISIFW